MKTLEAETLTDRSVSIKKILVAVDLSDHSEATALYAASQRHPRRLDRHCLSSPDFSRKSVQSGQKRLKSCTELLVPF